MPSVAFTTLGCRLNQSEIDRMARQFARQGHEIAETAEGTDLVVVGMGASDLDDVLREAATAQNRTLSVPVFGYSTKVAQRWRTTKLRKANRLRRTSATNQERSSSCRKARPTSIARLRRWPVWAW
mgnify:CR=1 FL=1